MTTITKKDFKRIDNDTNGNPRYVIHYTLCEPECFDNLPMDERYAATVKIMNKIGGRKYYNKKYGGGVVFQSYNLDRDIEAIHRQKYVTQSQWGMLDTKRKYYNYERLLLDSDSEECGGAKTDKEKAAYIYNRFVAEYGFQIERFGFYDALTEWLCGLALCIPYSYDDIIALANAEDKPAKDQDKICENYFNFMAMRLQSVWKHFGII